MYGVLLNVYRATYPGKVPTNIEKRQGFWTNIRWPVVRKLILILPAIYIGAIPLAMVISIPMVIRIWIFYQGIHSVTKDNESAIKAILGV